jgi:hypothetical protein
MAGLLDFLAGSSDPGTADPTTGLVDAQRKQLAYGILGQTGAALLAAGAPTMPGSGQQAQALAQLGNIPGNLAQQQSQMVQQNVMVQREQALKRENEQKTELVKYMQTPDFQSLFNSLPPAQKAVVSAAAKIGDTGAVLKALQEAQVATQPKFNSDGTIYFPASGDIIDPIRGTKTNVSNLTTGGQAPGDGSNAGVSANAQAGPTGDAFLATVSPGYGNFLKSVADGRESISPMLARTPAGQKILMDLNRMEPGFDQTNYQERQNFRKSVTSGPLFQNVILPANKMLDHANDYLNSYDKLGMDSGVTSYVTNNMKYANAKINRTGEFQAAELNLNTFKKEFEKVMAGKGQLTDEARRTMDTLSPTASPEETYAVIGKMVQMMKGQVGPVEIQKDQTMGKSMPKSLIQEPGQAVMARVQAGPPGQRAQPGAAPAPGETAPPTPPSTTTAQGPQGQPPLPPGADTSKFEYRYDPVRGVWQQRRK